MRTNLPVTNQELILRENILIVSRTDTSGNILYINEDFLEASGFTEAELIGQPHNIVRHPDMPKEAFADMWAALKDGRPWTGMVKNRCKNGDHYWVEAQATPVVENGNVTGYMSVRRKADRQKVETFERAYRNFREGKAEGLQVLNGEAVSTSTTARWKRSWIDTSLRKKLNATISLLLFLMVLFGAGWAYTINEDGSSFDKLYAHRLVPVIELAEINLRTAENRAQIMLALQHEPENIHSSLHADHSLQTHLDVIEANAASNTESLATYARAVVSDEHEKLFANANAAREAFISQGQAPAIAALKKGDFNAVSNLLVGINPLYADVIKTMEALRTYQSEAGAKQLQTAQARQQQIFIAIGIVLLLAIVCSVLLGSMLRSTIMGSLTLVQEAFGRMAQGQFDRAVSVSRNDELGKVQQNLQSMQIRLGFNIAEQKRVGDEMTRIKISLDNVSSNVMIADNNRNIIYTNKTVIAMLQNAEADIRKALPNFDSSKLDNSSIDQFHQNPEHQKRLLATFTSTYRAQVVIGGRTFALTANPVINEQGERLGSVVEWLDRTLEVAVENEVDKIVTAAAAGDFSKRISAEGKTGFFLSLASGLNQLTQTAEQGLNDVVRVLGALAQGDLTQRITADYQGTFGQLKDFSNETASSLGNMLGQIREAADTIYTAASEISAGNTDLSSRTEEQASSLEETASSMEELTSTVKLNADNARQANSLAVNASEVAVDGGNVVGLVVATMSSINESARKISDIIGVIDGIAFQTNILALNAAVEAARAGEQGRGFAVVAAEVRNLAQRSAAAAKEIKSLISDSVDKVENGNQLVSQAGTTMGEIVVAIKRVTDIMAEIAAASAEQSTGIEEVNGAVGQMDEMTQQNAALVEQAAASAESLLEQASVMTQAVAVFKFDHAMHSNAPSMSGRQRQAVAVQPRAARAQASLPKPGKAKDDEWEEF